MPSEVIAAPPAAAPAAPAPSPNAAPARPAAARPAAAPAAPKTSAVRTPASTVGKPATPPPAAAVENPFDKANADLAKFAEPDEEEPKPPGAPKTEKPAKPAKAAEPVEDPDDEGEATPESEEKPEEKPEVKPAAGEKPKKPSPWTLLETYKGRALKAEQEIAELRGKPGELPKEHQERFAAIEARNKELEDEIRYVNFSKSKEFVEQYQKPYEDAWANAVADLKELVIQNEDGTSRTASAHDLIALANMPLGQARQTAKLWFGDSADDVMAHRRVIRDLSEKQTKALDDSKVKGGEREQQRTAEMQAKQKARSEEASKVWKAVNEEAVAKYEYLRPVEGETERNTKLEKAQQFVDETMRKSVGQAKTQEERDQILKQHAAVRNRAIGFSVLKHENVSLKAKVAELEKAIAEFQGSEPTGGQVRHEGNGEGATDEMGAAMNRMTRYVT